MSYPYMDTGEYAHLNRLYAKSFLPVNRTSGIDADENGLVHRHKNDRKHFPVSISIYQNMIEVHVPSPDKAKHHPHGKRNRITIFSKSSRRNMIKLTNKLRNHTDGYFVHLTYPSKFEFTPKEVKSHLASMRKRLMRAFEGIGCIWRMELKRRLSGESEGMLVPHFHVLVFGAKQAEINALDVAGYENRSMAQITRLRLWIAQAWNEVINGGETHKKVGTRCDKINSMRHASAYVSKYAAKCEDDEPNEDEPSHWGRRWGTFGDLDTSEYMTIRIPYADVANLKRMLRKLLIARDRVKQREIRQQNAKKKRKKARYWRNRSLNSERCGCSILGVGNADTKTLTKMILVLSGS